MMAMKYHTPSSKLHRSLELRIWKEATTVFMTSGLGGCGPFGLAVATQRRGYPTRVVLSDCKTPFVSSVRTQEKREVIRLMHARLQQDARALGVTAHYFSFTFGDIAAALRHNEIPIVLISTYRLHKVRAPHWVVVTEFDKQNVFFHDPYEAFYLADRSLARNLAIPIPEVTKSVVFVGASR
jgi:hypothetical protein